MNTAATLEYAPRQSWFGRAEDWLDRNGKGAWLIAMVFGFIFFWPIGLALLTYMIWSKKCLEYLVIFAPAQREIIR